VKLWQLEAELLPTKVIPPLRRRNTVSVVTRNYTPEPVAEEKKTTPRRTLVKALF
jgi:hypothetical protein